MDAGQALPQLPQLFDAVSVSTHVPPQLSVVEADAQHTSAAPMPVESDLAVCPAGHEPAHASPLQFERASAQESPQLPSADGPESSGWLEASCVAPAPASELVSDVETPCDPPQFTRRAKPRRLQVFEKFIRPIPVGCPGPTRRTRLAPPTDQRSE